MQRPFNRIVNTMATSVHAIAKVGFGTGTNELYDRYGFHSTVSADKPNSYYLDQSTSVLSGVCHLAHSQSHQVSFPFEHSRVSYVLPR